MEAKKSNKTDKKKLIYIAGINPRSGTNWLYSLISKHPECRRALGWEDYFLHHANHLSAYAQDLRVSWKEDWPLHQRNAETTVVQQFGRGLRHVLACPNDKSGPCEAKRSIEDISEARLLTKTPSAKNIDHFFALFPESHLIILVRDGRSVVESGMRTFQWPFEPAVRRWRDMARTILEFDKRADNGLYHIIRYEDLFRNTTGELRELLEFLNLDPSVYDFESAVDTPVKGSSTYGRNDGDVGWEPIEKEKDFSPLRRWEGWSEARLDRFNWLAREEMRAFGYTIEPGSKAWKRRIRDGYWTLVDRMDSGIRRLRRGVGRRIMP